LLRLLCKFPPSALQNDLVIAVLVGLTKEGVEIRDDI